MNSAADKRYFVVQKEGELVKITYESDAEAQKAKNLLVAEMSNAAKRQFVYSDFRRRKNKYLQVTLSYLKRKIDSKPVSLRTIDEAVIKKYSTTKPEDLDKLKNKLASFCIAYKVNNQIKFLELLNPDEFEFVKSPEALYKKVLTLLDNSKFDIFKFCRQNKIDSMRDMRTDFYNMLIAYNKIPVNGKADFNSSVYNLIIQLLSGDGKTEHYKRFRCFALAVKKKLEQLEAKEEKLKQMKTVLEDIKLLNNLFDIENQKEIDEKPIQLKKELD